MNFVKLISIGAVFGLLSACTFQTTSIPGVVGSEQSAGWHLHGVDVNVPAALTTSDVNIFQPNVDIVWHGDPMGDRKAQVATIIEDAIESAAENMIGPRGVRVQATLIHFHSLTPRARSVAGRVHKISFSLQVVDDETGQVLAGPEIIQADVKAYGAWQAVNADANNQTMKVRISDRITEVVKAWLGVATLENVEEKRILAIGH